MLKSRIENAVKLHIKGYDCAQSIACNYCDLLGIDMVDCFKSLEAFGLGMGINLTCGTISGMVYLIGHKISDGNLSEPKTKRICYQKCEELIKEFEKKCTSTVCADIKGLKNNKPVKHCNQVIVDCARIIEEMLFEGMFEKSDYVYEG